MSKPKPTDPELWDKAKRIVKARVKAWPSAYASGQLVQKYKDLGGTFTGTRADGGSGLARWYKEEWVNVCAWPKKEKCGGDPQGSGAKRPMRYCRPSKRVTRGTPVTVTEMSAADREKMCAKKRRSPTSTMPAAKKKEKQN